MLAVFDIRGCCVKLAAPAQRVVSLLPSLTESVAGLGRREVIVGCTRFCAEPEGIIQDLLSKRGVIGGPKDPDVGAIGALAPDLVLANREENRREDVEWIERFTQVHVSEPRTVEDVWHLLTDLGLLLGAESEAREWVEDIRRQRLRLNRARAQARGLRFGYLVWWDPAMVAGGDTYVSNLLQEGPFVNAFSGLTRYPEVSAEELVAAEMDVLFVPSEPYEFDEAALVEVRGGAGRARIERIDGQMCAWHGTRTAPALEYIHELAAGLGGR